MLWSWTHPPALCESLQISAVLVLIVLKLEREEFAKCQHFVKMHINAGCATCVMVTTAEEGSVSGPETIL